MRPATSTTRHSRRADRDSPRQIVSHACVRINDPPQPSNGRRGADQKADCRAGQPGSAALAGEGPAGPAAPLGPGAAASLLPPAPTVAPHRESTLTHARSALDPGAFSRCHSAGCRVSSQEYTGMVDLGTDGQPRHSLSHPYITRSARHDGVGPRGSGHLL